MAFAVARRDTLADINITPLVDVMLVLLFIFMVTAPALSYQIQVDLPQRTSNPPPPPPSPTAVLSVQPGDLFALDGVAMTPGRLQAALADWHQRVPDGVLKVDVSPEADYQSAATALAAADRAGIDQVGVVEY